VILRSERWRLAGWLGGVPAAEGYQRMFGVLPGRRRDARLASRRGRQRSVARPR